MTNVFYKSENWESDISDVEIIACAGDPLGYDAVFHLTGSSQQAPVTFRVGASLLGQRASSLALAGYNAPMTRKALDLLASRLETPSASAA